MKKFEARPCFLMYRVCFTKSVIFKRHVDAITRGATFIVFEWSNFLAFFVCVFSIFSYQISLDGCCHI